MPRIDRWHSRATQRVRRRQDQHEQQRCAHTPRRRTTPAFVSMLHNGCIFVLVSLWPLPSLLLTAAPAGMDPWPRVIARYAYVARAVEPRFRAYSPRTRPRSSSLTATSPRGWVLSRMTSVITSTLHCVRSVTAASSSCRPLVCPLPLNLNVFRYKRAEQAIWWAPCPHL